MTFFLLSSMYFWHTWLIHLPFLMELVCPHEHLCNHVWKLLQLDACFGCLVRSHWVQWHQNFPSTWMSAINSSIFGNSDCTLAVNTFIRLLGCISLTVFVGGGFPGGGDGGTCGVWGAVGCCCPCCPCCWLQLFVLLVIVPAGYVIFVGRDRLCCLWPSLYFVNNHWFILVLPH